MRRALRSRGWAIVVVSYCAKLLSDRSRVDDVRPSMRGQRLVRNTFAGKADAHTYSACPPADGRRVLSGHARNISGDSAPASSPESLLSPNRSSAAAQSPRREREAWSCVDSGGAAGVGGAGGALRCARTRGTFDASHAVAAAQAVGHLRGGILRARYGYLENPLHAGGYGLAVAASLIYRNAKRLATGFGGMELTGLEPVTFALPARRSPN
jgi:hypothetical protein